MKHKPKNWSKSMWANYKAEARAQEDRPNPLWVPVSEEYRAARRAEFDQMKKTAMLRHCIMYNRPCGPAPSPAL